MGVAGVPQLPGGCDERDAVTVLAKSGYGDANRAEDAEWRVVADARDRRAARSCAQGVGEVVEAGEVDPEYPSESLCLGSADLVVSVEAIGHELLANPERLRGVRKRFPDDRRPAHGAIVPWRAVPSGGVVAALSAFPPVGAQPCEIERVGTAVVRTSAQGGLRQWASSYSRPACRSRR